jgi:hypothetical protein
MDAMQRIANTPKDGTLFAGSKLAQRSTSTLAGEQAARKSGSMRLRIVERLRRSPATLFEVAADFRVPDHTISGRFTELCRDLVIERTGVRKTHPVSECQADVWRISRDAVAGSQISTDQVLDRLG